MLRRQKHVLSQALRVQLIKMMNLLSVKCKLSIEIQTLIVWLTTTNHPACNDVCADGKEVRLDPVLSLFSQRLLDKRPHSPYQPPNTAIRWEKQAKKGSRDWNHDSQWRDRSLYMFLRWEIGQFSPHLGAISWANYKQNLERKEN